MQVTEKGCIAPLEKMSIHKAVYRIFLSDPNGVYTTADLVSILNSRTNHNTRKEIITTILTRLYRKTLIQRTTTQLSKGYYYSKRNTTLLTNLYEEYLLPYQFENKQDLLKMIKRSKFDSLDSDTFLDLQKISKFPFVSKYCLGLFKRPETQQFLALLVGFIMCDGSINSQLTRVKFFFRRKDDAKLFVKNFQQVFPEERFRIKPMNEGASYVAELSRGSSLAKILHQLGAPKGNKVLQPFLVPNWILNGTDELKKTFLSTVIGNEGSAPSDRRWRIQFVLSKCKGHVLNLLVFLNQIRTILYYFGITTSHIQLRKQKNRHFHGRFYLKGEDNLQKFYNKLSFFYASEKQEILEDLILNKSKECNAQ